jgi:beta-lactamase class A
MRCIRIIIALLWLLPAPAHLLAAAPDDYPPLRDSVDPRLQRGLEKSIDALALRDAVDERKLAITLVDITDMDTPRYAALNGDEMLYAASLPKIAILLGAFVQIEQGKMTMTPEIKQSLTRMIRASSNADATRMLNRVGKRQLIDILMSDRFRLYDPAVNGGLWVGKEYGRSPAYQRDPLHNLSHGATALQTARFYYLLETKRLLRADLSRQMKAMLGNPGIRHKFVKSLAKYPGLRIYRKSGSWRHWHADSAIVEAGKHKYIAVVLAEHPEASRWLPKIIQRLHELIVPTAVARAATP